MLKVILTGHLGSDPDFRYLPSGTPVANFPVAVNSVRTNANGERIEETTWLRVSVFGKLAEVCNQYLRKGRQVLVVGRLRPDPQTGGPRIWTDKDGNSRANFEVVAESVEFLGSKGEAAENPGGQEPPTESNDLPTPGEDIPF